MYDAIARLLAFFYSLPVVGGSYGVAIILLTGAVMIVLMPLTVRATRSTIKMQALQPQLKELQKKYKDDKPTLNAELMEMYKTQGINPVGGCLPMLAQLPVFLVLFNVLRGLSRRLSETAYFTIAEHARAQAGGTPVNGRTFDPKYLASDSQMSVDLHLDDRMQFGPFDLALHPIDVLQDSFLRGIPYVLLILFVVGTSFYQQRQISSRRNGSMPGMNPQQEMILKFLPLMSGIWSFAFPAGLVLYWATSNVFRIAQQGYITRAFYGDKDEPDDGGGAGGSGAVDDVSEQPVTAKGAKAGEAKGKDPAKDSAKGGRRGGGTGDDEAGGARGAKAGGGTAGKAGTGGGGYRNGRSPRTRTGPQTPRTPAEATNGRANGEAAANGEVRPAKLSAEERAEAWAQRRQDKARAQAARSRAEQPSRVTPKGTRPGDSKRKRKR
jgi:YidC/Oxa1 family membrane protein insertase